MGDGVWVDSAGLERYRGWDGKGGRGTKQGIDSLCPRGINDRGSSDCGERMVG